MPKEIMPGHVVVKKPPSKSQDEERSSPWLGLVTSCRGANVNFDWVLKLQDFGQYAVGIAKPIQAKTDLPKILALFPSVYLTKFSEDAAFEKFVFNFCFPCMEIEIE